MKHPKKRRKVKETNETDEHMGRGGRCSHFGVVSGQVHIMVQSCVWVSPFMPPYCVYCTVFSYLGPLSFCQLTIHIPYNKSLPFHFVF